MGQCTLCDLKSSVHFLRVYCRNSSMTIINKQYDSMLILNTARVCSVLTTRIKQAKISQTHSHIHLRTQSNKTGTKKTRETILNRPEDITDNWPSLLRWTRLNHIRNFFVPSLFLYISSCVASGREKVNAIQRNKLETEWKGNTLRKNPHGILLLWSKCLKKEIVFSFR